MNHQLLVKTEFAKACLYHLCRRALDRIQEGALPHPYFVKVYGEREVLRFSDYLCENVPEAIS